MSDFQPRPSVQQLTNCLFNLSLRYGTLPLQLTITGNSMFPSLKSGDRVTVRREDTYSPGDIVVFRHNGGLTIHRLLWQLGNRVTCKGDNNLFCEEVYPEDILGKVVEISAGDVRLFPTHGPLLAVLSYNKILIYKAHVEDKLSTRRDPAYVEIQHFLHGLRRNLIKKFFACRAIVMYDDLI